LSEESSLILGEQRDVIVKFDRILDPQEQTYTNILGRFFKNSMRRLTL